MTAYQRGNRDGLLSLAKQLEAVIREEESDLIRLQEARGLLTKKPTLLVDCMVLERLARHRLWAAQRCHRLALAAAEALPDDPEAP